MKLQGLFLFIALIISQVLWANSDTEKSQSKDEVSLENQKPSDNKLNNENDDQHVEKVLAPFTTDGCSLSPNGVPRDPERWLDCCILHDVAYWAGGEESLRDQADLEFKQCVEKKQGPRIAKIMYKAVRSGGKASLPTTYRWGYGWNYLLSDEALSTEQKEQVKNLMPLDPLSVEYETTFDIIDMRVWHEYSEQLMRSNK